MSDAPRVSDADLVALLRTSYADSPLEWLQAGNVRGLLDGAADRLEALAARVAELERERERVKEDLLPLHHVAGKIAPAEVWGQNIAKWAADRITAAEERAARLQAENDELRADLKHVQDTTGRVPVRHVTYEDGPGLTWKDALEKTQGKLAAAEVERDGATQRAQMMFEQKNLFRDRLAAAEAQRDRLTAFAEHRVMCAGYQWVGGSERLEHCNCGLRETLAWSVPEKDRK